ncbi:MAG: endonuclease/exonuclease/phosphatase family protein [Candidatus Competibacteraceae bacterium]|jgi:endonuclease/exonuclease/phosphatase family metal-dependent hydrolase|nr:endonuclease/exonuclease/phosphatase family protein [Candidatus Competibacteraceae bacterium]
MLRLLAIFVFLVSFSAPVFPQDITVGDTVRLIERDIHIPAHPAPGNSQVPFRFAGGTSAEVLAIDSDTGWIEILGERVGGVQTSGWITQRYIDTVVTSPAPSNTPVWCPPKGSPEPHPSGRLRIATWNIENLHAEDGGTTYTGNDPSVARVAADYARIRCYVRLFDPDILAVQEVDGEAALKRIVDNDVYDVVVSQRPKPDFMSGRQNTGFAYKKGLDVQPKPDFQDLDIASDGRLRYGTRIDLTHQGITLQLMSVHLKSGCFSGGSGSVCQRLFGQAKELEDWIDAAAEGPHPFIVLGDFNRRFNIAGDVIWQDLDDGEPTNADLLAVTENMPISCRDNKYPDFIDHIVLDKRATRFVDRSSFRHVTYRQADKPAWDKISDHCPVMIEMWLP